MIENYTKFLKALGEPTRLKIINLLAEKEMCVCELMEVLEMNQPRISQHLKVLKEAGVVQERKQAQWSHYSLCCDEFQGFVVKSDMKNIADWLTNTRGSNLPQKMTRGIMNEGPV